MTCRGEGRYGGLVPLSMQSLTNQILTDLLPKKMFAFHQVIRMEQLNQHRFYLGKVWKSKDREVLKAREDHRGSLGRNCQCSVKIWGSPSSRAPHL